MRISTRFWGRLEKSNFLFCGLDLSNYYCDVISNQIYNSMSNRHTTPFTELREPLTSSELVLLKSLVLGYGNFRATAQKAGVHVETLRGVINRGYGERETVNKIRTVLIEAGVKTETKSTAA